jgi:hypothetical protein
MKASSFVKCKEKEKAKWKKSLASGTGIPKEVSQPNV